MRMSLRAFSVDGSIGEGGGQVLRVAVALAAVLGCQLRVFNIRARRNPPGLRAQHLTAVKAVASLAKGRVEGLKVGSTQISFEPGELSGGKMEFDAGTAGSTTLILQSLMPVMAFAGSPVDVVLRGGTNNPMAPPYEYLENVLLPVLRGMGFDATLKLHRRGFYPRGQGVISAHSKPVDVLKPVRLVGEARVVKITGLSYSCRLPEHITQRMARSAEQFLKKNGYDDVSIAVEALAPENPRCSPDPGTGIILFAHTDLGTLLAVDKLGERGVPAERVGEEAARSLIEELQAKAPVDSHLGDQLVIWAALAEGESEYEVSRITSHTLTSVEVCRQLTGAVFEVDGKLGERGRVRCRGIGLKRG